MKIRVTTYDGNNVTMEVQAEWPAFLDAALIHGWVGCDGFWTGLANVRSMVEIAEPMGPLNNVVPLKPVLVNNCLTEGDNLP
jgi:hypothetical protein